ncbi:helix-turn-helix transcriptional regulator [Nocardia sp. NPDC050435]|uniref:helix-turn-helix domain-containing protein n=1 Tax=Nocardia sp. NPDC050435 TaxID=3155040 RepID=UPI0033D307BF
MTALPPAVVGARLRMAREAAGMTLGTLAVRTSWSKSALGHFETGRRNPPAAVITFYEELFGHLAADPVTSMAAVGRADVDRRSFLTTATYSMALSATALALPKEAVARIVGLNDSHVVGMPEVEAVRAVTDAFLRFDEVRGGGMGRTAVAEFLATDVATLLRSRFADPTVRTAAFSAAAELAYIAGFKAHDAGADQVGQRYYLKALGLVEHAQVPGQDAWILRILALQGADINKATFSPALAEAALNRGRGHLGPDATALLMIAAARCYAETGRRSEALAALRAAEPYMSTELTSEQPRWISMWAPNKAILVDQAAKTFLTLGDQANAVVHYELAASMWNKQTHARVWALSTAQAGRLQWKRGDYVTAVNTWRPALPILHSIDSTRTAKALTAVRRTAPELFAGTAAGSLPQL